MGADFLGDTTYDFKKTTCWEFVEICSWFDYIVMLPIAYVTNWMEHSAGEILSYIGIFFTCFLIVWLIHYRAWKSRVREMNDSIQKKGIYRTL